jgi:hypothetical protein
MHAIATYWPIPNDNELSLWGKLKTHATRHDHESPISYIRTLIAAQLAEHTLNNETVIVVGDFNSDISRKGANGVLSHDRNDLSAFLQATGLTHSSNPKQLLIQSYSSDILSRTQQSPDTKGCSRIDYQFHNNLNIIASSCFPTECMYDLCRPHRPLFASYQLTEYSNQKKVRRYHKTIHDVSMKNEVQLFLVTSDYKNMYMDMQAILLYPHRINSI